MVRCAFALVAVCTLGASAAQAAPAAFPNSSPIDYSRPFLFDALQPTKVASSSVSLPVEIITVEIVTPEPGRWHDPAAQQVTPTRPNNGVIVGAPLAPTRTR